LNSDECRVFPDITGFIRLTSERSLVPISGQ
jgi:hypothetical protein